MRPTRPPRAAPRAPCRLERLEARDTPTFTPLAPFPLPATDPRLVVAGDFNRDGTPDLAVASGSAVSILIGAGDGTFTRGQQFTDPAIAGPVSLLAADLNGDGNPDLVVASPGNAATQGGTAVFLGVGNGTFGQRVFLDPSPAAGAGVGDLTNDGVPDLVVVNPVGSAFGLSVLAGKGDGTFTRSPVLVPTTTSGGRVLVADFDGDGNQDVAAFDPAGSVSVFYGDGAGGFPASTGFVTTAPPTDIAVADFDSDGRPDILAAEGNQAVFRSNPGGRSFDTPAVTTLAVSSQLRRLAVADFDANGLPDFVAIDDSGGASVVVSDGSGLFSPDANNPYPVPPVPADVTTGDFNRDGSQDFATVSANPAGLAGQGRVFLNDLSVRAPTRTDLSASPTSSTPGRPITLTADVTSLVPTDSTPTGTVTFLEGGRVLGTAPLNSSATATLTVTSLSVGAHTVTATYSGDPGFQPSPSGPVTVRVLDVPTYSVGSDNGAVVCVQEAVTVGHGVAVFGPEFTGVRPAAADFNADGISDHAVGSGVGDVPRVAIVNGATGAVTTIAPFEESFRGGVFTAAGDVDGDGIPDVAVAAGTGGGSRVQLYLTRGGSLVKVADFMAFADDPGFRGGTRVALGDVDHDGLADLVVAAGPGGAPRVAVFGGASMAAGAPARIRNDFFAYDPGFRGGAFVAVGDTTGDGFGEVIVGAEVGGGPRVVVFDGASVAAGGVPLVLADFFAGPATNRGGIRVAARDLNQDGIADVITGAGAGDGSQVRVYPGQTLRPGTTPTPSAAFDSFPGLVGGVYVG